MVGATKSHACGDTIPVGVSAQEARQIQWAAHVKLEALPLDEDTKIHKLLNLIFSEIHLVKHPANRKPILLLKSESVTELEGDEQGGTDMNDEEKGLELEVAPVMTDTDQSVVSKALDIIKSLVGVKPTANEEASVVKKEDEDKNGDVEDLGKKDSVSDASDEVVTDNTEEIDEESLDTPELDEESAGGGDALVNTVNDLIEVAKSNWEELPKVIQSQIDVLAKATGSIGDVAPEAEAPEENKVEKSENGKSKNEELLEKSLDEQRVRLEKMENELAQARREKRLMELVPISKSVGEFDAEQLYKLEGLDSDLFEEVVKHMGSLQKRVETSGFFGETGTAAPIKKGSPVELLEKAAREHMKESGEVDYATALDYVSAMPEHRDHIPQLYRESDQGGVK